MAVCLAVDLTLFAHGFLRLLMAFSCHVCCVRWSGTHDIFRFVDSEAGDVHLCFDHCVLPRCSLSNARRAFRRRVARGFLAETDGAVGGMVVGLSTGWPRRMRRYAMRHAVWIVGDTLRSTNGEAGGKRADRRDCLCIRKSLAGVVARYMARTGDMSCDLSWAPCGCRAALKGLQLLRCIPTRGMLCKIVLVQIHILAQISMTAGQCATLKGAWLLVHDG
jgi:hypothetical protein